MRRLLHAGWLTATILLATASLASAQEASAVKPIDDLNGVLVRATSIERRAVLRSVNAYTEPALDTTGKTPSDVSEDYQSGFMVGVYANRGDFKNSTIRGRERGILTPFLNRLSMSDRILFVRYVTRLASDELFQFVRAITKADTKSDTP